MASRFGRLPAFFKLFHHFLGHFGLQWPLDSGGYSLVGVAGVVLMPSVTSSLSFSNIKLVGLDCCSAVYQILQGCA